MIYAKPSTSLVVVFRAYLASDHVTPATGKTIAVTISKNGGAFGNPNAGATNATEISSGFYKVTLDTTDTGTAGPLAVRGAAATIDDVGILYYVGQAPADVTHFGGSAATTSGGRPEVNATHLAGTAYASADLSATMKASVNTEADTALADVGLTTTVTGRVDAAVSTRLATAGYTAPLDAAGTRSAVGLASANLDTQLSAIAAYIDTEVASILAAVDTEVAAIKAKTDNLPASPAATGDIPTANANADALLDRSAGVETGVTVRQALRGILSSALAKLSGAATTTVVIRDVNDTKNRISATVDASGNRSAVTLDLT